jgi:hypothetical protein
LGFGAVFIIARAAVFLDVVLVAVFVARAAVWAVVCSAVFPGFSRDINIFCVHTYTGFLTFCAQMPGLWVNM